MPVALDLPRWVKSVRDISLFNAEAASRASSQMAAAGSDTISAHESISLRTASDVPPNRVAELSLLEGFTASRDAEKIEAQSAFPASTAAIDARWLPVTTMMGSKKRIGLLTCDASTCWATAALSATQLRNPWDHERLAVRDILQFRHDPPDRTVADPRHLSHLQP